MRSFLDNTETGEAIALFDDGSYSHEMFSPEALIYHRGLDEKISYTLPGELLETEDRFFSGRAARMFCQEEKQKYGIYGTIGSCLWNTTGGLLEQLLVYRKEEKTVDIRFGGYNGVNPNAAHSNDRRTAMGSAVREFRGGELQNIDGCENMTSLQGLFFPKYAIKWLSMLTWFNQKEAGNLTKKEMKENLSNRKLWIVCVMDEKQEPVIDDETYLGYVFFFDAERYTKEQMIALAKSIHLK